MTTVKVLALRSLDAPRQSTRVTREDNDEVNVRAKAMCDFSRQSRLSRLSRLSPRSEAEGVTSNFNVKSLLSWNAAQIKKNNTLKEFVITLLLIFSGKLNLLRWPQAEDAAEEPLV
jgi:hypothetical protein